LLKIDKELKELKEEENKSSSQAEDLMAKMQNAVMRDLSKNK
jgi:hypothetical protein